MAIGTIAGIIYLVVIGIILSVIFRLIGSKIFNFSEILKKVFKKSEKK